MRILSLTLLLLSCQSIFGNPSVLILDEAGDPIEGASVTPISLSINYIPQKTDEKGQVTIPSRLQKVKWITVDKIGYEPSGYIDFSGKKPLKVLLKKKKS